MRNKLPIAVRKMLLRRSRAASLIITAVGAAALLAFPRIGASAPEANSGANPNSEPFPITVDAKPSTSLVGCMTTTWSIWKIRFGGCAPCSG